MPPFKHGFFSQGSNLTKTKRKRTRDAHEKAFVPAENIKSYKYNSLVHLATIYEAKIPGEGWGVGEIPLLK